MYLFFNLTTRNLPLIKQQHQNQGERVNRLRRTV